MMITKTNAYLAMKHELEINGEQAGRAQKAMGEILEKTISSNEFQFWEAKGEHLSEGVQSTKAA